MALKKEYVICLCPSPREEEQEQTYSSSLPRLGVSCWSLCGSSLDLGRHNAGHSRAQEAQVQQMGWSCPSWVLVELCIMWLTRRGHHFTRDLAVCSQIFVDLYGYTGKAEQNRDTWKWLGQASAHSRVRFDWNALKSYSRYKIWTQKEAEERPVGGPRRSLLKCAQISKE